MSDIDFDELDRAVNGVLGGTNTPAPTPVQSLDTLPETPAETTTEAPTITRVERTQLSPSTPSAVPTPVVSSAPAARRSSGRFMDMVHPSSDMRSQTVGNLPVAKPQAPVRTETTSVTPEPVESPAWNEPLESPFLPDAKVQKRPLGGGEAAATTNTPSIVDSFDFQGLLDEPEEPLLEAPEPQERIEAHTMPDPIDFAAAKAITDEVEVASFEPEIEEQKVEEVSVQTTPEVIAPQPIAETTQPVVEEPIGPTSITPQYKEQASSNQQSGAMYDTESYHQAVSTPPKKKSGWFTVVLILLLVVLGAGGGFAVYTYVLPML